MNLPGRAERPRLPARFGFSCRVPPPRKLHREALVCRGEVRCGLGSGATRATGGGRVKGIQRNTGWNCCCCWHLLGCITNSATLQHHAAITSVDAVSDSSFESQTYGQQILRHLPLCPTAGGTFRRCSSRFLTCWLPRNRLGAFERVTKRSKDDTRFRSAISGAGLVCVPGPQFRLAEVRSRTCNPDSRKPLPLKRITV